MRRVIRYPIAWLFGYREVPYSSRVIFRRELFHILCWGVVWGSVNGGFCGYVARRSFGASALLVSVIAAAMALANLFAVWWAAFMRRHNKQALMTGILIATCVLLGSFWATPYCTALNGEAVPEWLRRWTSQSQPISALVFAIQVVLTWILLQAVNTVRTTIWKQNYPDSHRGRILARFAVWQIIIGGLWGAWMGAYLDGGFAIGSERIGAAVDLHWIPGAGTRVAYAYIIPMGGLAALLSAVFFSRVHIRKDGQQSPLPSSRAGTESAEFSYATPGWFATRFETLVCGLRDSYEVLRSDRRFREYMGWQFLSGSAIMMVQVPFILILQDVFDINYLQAAGLLSLVPQFVLAATTPIWARLFDHWSIFRYRAIQAGVWALSRALLTVGVWQRSMGLVLISVIVSGLALAGGRFAWQLGHMTFSNQTNDSTYLGIHQTLTGIRGLTMPFLGALLYLYVLNWHVIWISMLMLLVASNGFRRMQHGAAPLQK